MKKLLKTMLTGIVEQIGSCQKWGLGQVGELFLLFLNLNKFLK